MDKKCTKCKYVSKNRSLVFCDYLGMTGPLRGCRADANCDKYEPRKRKTRSKD